MTRSTLRRTALASALAAALALPAVAVGSWGYGERFLYEGRGFGMRLDSPNNGTLLGDLMLWGNGGRDPYAPTFDRAAGVWNPPQLVYSPGGRGAPIGSAPAWMVGAARPEQYTLRPRTRMWGLAGTSWQSVAGPSAGGWFQYGQGWQ